ncbi:MAG: HAD family hydrolase [Oscillospiraceae bacterium]
MQYTAAIFDIDGTLLPKGDKAPSLALQNAIKALQDDGICVIIATGRAHFSAKAVLGDIKPDYLLATNGSHVTDKKDRLLFSTCLDSQQMYALVDYCEDYELPLEFAFEDGYYIYVEKDRFIENYGGYAGSVPYMYDGEDQVRHLESMPFGACVQATNEELNEFHSKNPQLGLRFVPFGGICNDVFCENVNKAVALGQLFDKIGLSLANSVAFGDGDNDVEMLREAGVGVCVGTKCPALSAVAQINVQQSELCECIKSIFTHA